MMAIRRFLLTRGILALFWTALFLGGLYVSRVIPRGFFKKNINIIAWVELLDAHKIAEFERETGIQVNISYYDNKDELLTKLQVGGGGNYDMIITTGYVVDTLIRKQMLQPMDRSRLSFLAALNPALLRHYYDPKNEYSIPYSWSVYGVGVDVRMIPNYQEITWKKLFDPAQLSGKRTVMDDPRELYTMGAYALYGSSDALNKDTLYEVQKLLVKQKPAVEAYTDSGSAYLLASGQTQMTITEGAYVMRLMNNYPHIKFWVPKEGSFMTIESVVIPRSTKKLDRIYSFINFLFKTDIMKHHAQLFYFLPSR
ncbi:spermidine/putrescine ABC transporter substrate-binding protein, partial [Candidatus Babeliales bacterium]|nr:spermidine/putrescine ABC transporter substrate-binding protein [Candidatus Babeliales bacterium]